MNWRRGLGWLSVVVVSCAASRSLVAADVRPKFDSQVVSAKTPGHAVVVDVALNPTGRLYLVVNDAGDSFSCDWADWAEPRLVGPAGEKKLTDLTWTSAVSDWGKVGVNRNAGGEPMKIDGQPVAYGIGTHANSLIEFAIPPGYTRFKARAGLDDGGANQGNGSTVRFLVFDEKPPASATRSAAAEPAANDRTPDSAVAALDVAPGLEATLFAAEPLLLSPSDIDVDHLGRVWVCEVVNYRHRNNSRPEGDRILILEDSDHDGKADKSTVFYQGRDIDSALGICVLGNRVIVSVAPNVFVFTDDNGDGKADRKELLFSKVGQAQHDHSTHAFVFGPDGKLYFNVGNSGQAVHDKEGRPITDLAGNIVAANGKPYRQGMVFRCNPDGSEFETLAHNFRNNYEVAVDSFGTLWQSDNDDDGNRGVRINYVMEFGNYGYTDEVTGAGWQSPRTNLEAEIPLRHWHLNDPGVVPNLVQTGGGSPTGICVYEGRLLPEPFQNQVIHCDAGPNICRAYPAVKVGAGYAAKMVGILEGARDKWFRPSDVCAAPDGSLIVADWYDPGVGGHHMGDIDKGRIFRVAPPGAKYRLPKYDFESAAGAIAALQSPNLEARYLAYTALRAMDDQAEPALLGLYQSSEDPRHRARALWLLSKLTSRGRQHAERALADPDSDLRITGLRALRELRIDLIPYLEKLVKDDSPQVRRECAIALRGNKASAAPRLWAELAAQHDGQDRWYLEALGIGAEDQWDAFFGAWLKLVSNQWNTAAGRDIVWRSRAAVSPEYLVKIISDPATAKSELPRYFRAFDFLSGAEKDAAVVQLAFATRSPDDAKQAYIVTEAIERLKGGDLNANPAQKAAVERALEQTQGSVQFVTLVDKFNITERFPQLLALARDNPDSQLGVEAVRVLLARQQARLIATALGDANATHAAAVARAVGNSGDGRAAAYLEKLIEDSGRPLEVRQEAVKGLAKSHNGAIGLLNRAEAKRLDPALMQTAAFALHAANFNDLKSRAAQVFPLPPSRNSQPLPPLADLLKRRGDAARGNTVFNSTGKCATCHVAGGAGKDVGPNLSEIGGKLSREAMFESILYPSAGISLNFETYAVELKSGNVVSGLMASQTPETISLKGADALVRTYNKSEIEEISKQSVSLMPADLQKEMSADELIDVIEFLQTLKPAAK